MISTAPLLRLLMDQAEAQQQLFTVSHTLNKNQVAYLQLLLHSGIVPLPVIRP